MELIETMVENIAHDFGENGITVAFLCNSKSYLGVTFLGVSSIKFTRKQKYGRYVP